MAFILFLRVNESITSELLSTPRGVNRSNKSKIFNADPSCSLIIQFAFLIREIYVVHCIQKCFPSQYI